MKKTKKWLIPILSVGLIVLYGIIALAETVFTKDVGTILENEVVLFSDAEELEESINVQLAALYGSKEYKGYLLYDNGREQVYSIISDNEKIGWHIVEANGILSVYDNVQHEYIFEAQEESDKITLELQELLQEETTEAVRVYIWLNDIDLEAVVSAIPATVSIKSYANGEVSVEEYLREKRSYVADAYSEYNFAFLEEYLIANGTGSALIGEELNELEETPIYEEVEFVSSYSPMTILTLTADQIYAMAENELVAEIGLYPEATFVSEATSATQAIQGTYVRDTYGYKGAGVAVGLIEYNAIPNVNYSELQNANITINPEYANETVADHGTMVASLIVGQTIGLAPDCHLYATMVEEYDVYFYRQMEWFIDQGVSVINMSFGLDLSSASTTYTLYDMWVDHIDMNHDVLVVKSAGNFTYLTAPGMAYNAITVGGYNDNNTGTYTDDTIYQSSAQGVLGTYHTAFIDTEGYAEKPELLAPAVDIAFPGYSSALSGTSFAAPLVTGTVAQLIGAYPSLTQPGQIKAILLASAFRRISDDNYTGIYAISGASKVSDIEGVGKLDSKNAIYVASQNNYSYEFPYVSSGFPVTRTISLDASESQIRIALCWLKQNTISGVAHDVGENVDRSRPLSDLDLKVYDPNGNLVAMSSSQYSNYELVEFDPTITGTYTIKVTCTGSTNTAEFLYLAWW